MSLAFAAPPFATVARLWPGDTCVIVGGGSSLTAEDVAYCRGKARVIAVKEAGACIVPGHVAPAPWADVLYAGEARWWCYVNGAPAFRGLKYMAVNDPQYMPDDWLVRCPDVQVLRRTGEEGLELDPSAVRSGWNSGYQAINIAVHRGVSKIVLLGFDCWTGPTGEQNWFGTHPTHLKSPYPIFLQAFGTLVEPLQALGIEIVNASRWTMLRAFPQVPLAEALP